MQSVIQRGLVLLALAAAWPVVAQDATLPSEYGKVVKSAEVVGSVGTDLFGDNTSMYTGSTEFAVTDVELPGTGLVPVRVGRRYLVEDRTGSYGRELGNDPPTYQFGDWQLDIPHLHGVFSRAWGWTSSFEDPYQRCTNVNNPDGARAPYIQVDGTLFAPGEYWSGNSLYMPGQGNQEMLVVMPDNPHKPANGVYRWVTPGQWYFSCLPAMAQGNGTPGEAFLAVGPDGTKYRFDWAVAYPAKTLTKSYGAGPVDGYQGSTFQATSSSGTTSKSPPGSRDNPLVVPDEGGFQTMAYNGVRFFRDEVWIYPTRIEDRFGNWVTFTYDSVYKGRLREIKAKDGRTLTLNYGTNGRVTSVTDTLRTWTYTYNTDGDTLTVVTLPDTSTWQYSLGALASLHAAADLAEPGCGGLPSNPQQTSRSGSITHPSGAVGTFTFKPTLHGRSYVDIKSCVPMLNESGNSTYVALHPPLYDAISLQSKRIEGPGLTPMNWTFAYGAHNGSFSSDCGSGCPDTKTVEVTGPSNWTRYVFSNRFRQGEGKLVRTDTGSGPANILRSESTSYLINASNQAFPSRIGASPFERSDRTAEKHAPLLQRQISQQGKTFTWQVNQTNGLYAFDAFANPTGVTRSSSLGYGRTDVTEYDNNLNAWVIGQVRKLTTDGIEASRATYNATTALPTATYRFGKLQNTLAYHPDGNLHLLTDGLNQTTTYWNWKRGIPQNVDYHDGTGQSAVVDNLGLIASVTNEVDAKTCYEYDAMGRLAEITYPSETQPGVCDTSKWAPTTFTFRDGYTSAYGMPAGHWRQTIVTGNARKTLIFDAFWRPVVEQTLDLGDVANTTTEIIRNYDADGRVVFESYPINTAGQAVYTDPTIDGTRTTYDSLGRPTKVERDWEIDGPRLATTTTYAAGFKTQVTNPRGYTTTTTYQAFDQPVTDNPVSIVHPAGAYTDIARDVFGKPLHITRRSATGTDGFWQRRYFGYNAYQELCSVTETETGNNAMGYDAAGNLVWSASGLAWNPSAGCAGPNDTAVMPRRVDRTYDTRNRLKTLTFPDGIGDQVWTYTPDGLPEQVTTYNSPNHAAAVINAYSYNARRLLDGQGESISQTDWYTWGLGYGYNANGHLVNHVYPNGITIDYAPNALGQPRQVGTFASNVKYHPNGAVAQFTYGNGIVHSMTPNDRQLPDRSTDSYGTTRFLDDGYDYDRNGNVAGISDGSTIGTSQRGNRSMTYDELDRLASATSAMFGGTINYTYDVLDNIQTLVAPGGRNLRYCYNTTWQLTFIRSGTTAPPTCSTGAATTTLDYDVQGNLWHKNATEHKFDYGNRLRTVTGKETYRYDAHGRRVLGWSAQGLGNILSMYDRGGTLRYVQDGRRSKRFEYFYLGGSLVASRETPMAGGTSVVKYQHTDALGSPVVVTDANRAVIEKSEYEPYGQLLNRPVENGPGYTGHVTDAATGLVYMQQRYYDPGIGAFLSVDPVTALSNPVGQFNRYRYANSNPYRFTDPDGRWACDACDELIAQAKSAVISMAVSATERVVEGFISDSKKAVNQEFQSSTYEVHAGVSTTVTPPLRPGLQNAVPVAGFTVSGGISLTNRGQVSLTGSFAPLVVQGGGSSGGLEFGASRSEGGGLLPALQPVFSTNHHVEVAFPMAGGTVGGEYDWTSSGASFSGGSQKLSAGSAWYMAYGTQTNVTLTLNDGK